MKRQSILAILTTWLLLAFGSTAMAMPCMIFVHGKQTDTGSFTNWTQARDYWRSGGSDFIGISTKNFNASHYVVGYNGTRPFWDSLAAGEVAAEIINATNGGADGGGNRCATSWAAGGNFWIIAHSMGGTVMDFILGNANSSTPNFNLNGAYDVVAQRTSLVVSVGGAHRGSQGADAVCGDAALLCNFIAGFIQDCDDATFWLRSSDDVQVRTFSNAPARNVYLIGGFEAIFGASACLSGEDDGVVQYASIFACGGSATASYNNSNVCNNGFKQEASGFFNLDSAHENHNDERNAVDSDERRQVPDGFWTCGGASCAPNTRVQTGMTTARFISTLY
ncbi:hypothetical protein AQ1_01056 [alpha proteobacterium Q-1]|nr:hypothetical protein AQ1_01056 [alpha proteobacterium Q-1]